MTIDPNNGVVTALSKVVDVIETTILTIICSIPIVTIGASVSAMHRTMMDIIMDRCSSVHRTFFSAFKEDFSLSGKIFIAAVLSGALILVDAIISFGYTGTNHTMAGISKGVTISLSILHFVYFSFCFASSARFKVTAKQAFQNAFLYCLGKTGWALLIALIAVVEGFSIYILSFYCIPVICLCLYIENRILLVAMLGKNALREQKKNNEGEIYYG